MSRSYYVVVKHKNGIHSWESLCKGFWLFSRVSFQLIQSWMDYSKEFTGYEGTVIYFKRISPTKPN